MKVLNSHLILNEQGLPKLIFEVTFDSLLEQQVLNLFHEKLEILKCTIKSAAIKDSLKISVSLSDTKKICIDDEDYDGPTL